MKERLFFTLHATSLFKRTRQGILLRSAFIRVFVIRFSRRGRQSVSAVRTQVHSNVRSDRRKTILLRARCRARRTREPRRGHSPGAVVCKTRFYQCRTTRTAAVVILTDHTRTVLTHEVWVVAKRFDVRFLTVVGEPPELYVSYRGRD